MTISKTRKNMLISIARERLEMAKESFFYGLPELSASPRFATTEYPMGKN